MRNDQVIFVIFLLLDLLVVHNLVLRLADALLLILPFRYKCFILEVPKTIIIITREEQVF